MSLPVVYGFVNTRWVHMTDFILREKKPGRNEIHMIRIIGRMSVEFNTMMKDYSKLAAHNYEKSNPNKE